MIDLVHHQAYSRQIKIRCRFDSRMTSPRDISFGLPQQGVTSNFIKPESLAPVALDLSVAMIILTTFFVLIRLYSNCNATRGLGWDDLCCVIATVLLYICIAISLSSIQALTGNFPQKNSHQYLIVRKVASHIDDIPLSSFTSPIIKVMIS